MSKSISPYKQQNADLVRSFTANPSKPPASSESLAIQQLLKILCPDGNITPSACAKVVEFTEKENKVKEVCDLSKVKTRPDDGRIYLIVKRKPISSTSYIGLIDKLYEHFFGIKNITMEQFFEIWMKWRDEETSVSKKTIKDNRFLYNSLLRDNPITKIPLKELSVQDYIKYFRSITKDRELTRKRFNDLKSIMNGILYLAVEQGILDRNCLRDINYRQFSYKAENTDVFPYTEDERLRIINHLDNDDFYSLAIKFDFHMIIRIGELKGLKWTDIKGDFIHIERYVDHENNIIEDIKGHQKEGKRFMPLTPSAKALLARIKELNPDSEYIFIRNGQPLATATFNRHLKKCCRELGIEYRSSHKVRFSTASIMYKNGAKATELSQLLGHTTLQMTNHYLRNITPAEETAEKMRAILG
ncbi:tyrosine-type recombinase/integrase [Clostridium sp. AM58-1XD]|uniref:tyrosine-type recombinase/integrase n=1 Tax=Clostridium sp. AM58-1XD TaxID=2292307 RepID=UPI0015F58212|nr:tyrosine-type recombinase/integrase [Clostridium sp. AM58-1XD]